MPKSKLPTLPWIKRLMSSIAKEHGIIKQVGETWKHSTVVWGFARKIAGYAISHGKEVNLRLLKIYCFAHDIGRMVAGSKGSRELKPAIYHFYEGYKIFKNAGYDKLARICVCHAGGTGLDRQVNKRYGFIAKDFFPSNIEERIMAYADLRTEFKKGKGPQIIPFKQAYQRFCKYPGAANRLKKAQKFIYRITNRQVA